LGRIKSLFAKQFGRSLGLVKKAQPALASHSLNNYTWQVPVRSVIGESMPPAAFTNPVRLRVVRRQATQPVSRVVIRPIRPSLLEMRLAGDPWIVPAKAPETLSLRFNDWQLVALGGLALDLPTFNRLLDQLRQRRPRRHR
jgi:hypothetical protein